MNFGSDTVVQHFDTLATLTAWNGRAYAGTKTKLFSVRAGGMIFEQVASSGDADLTVGRNNDTFLKLRLDLSFNATAVLTYEPDAVAGHVLRYAYQNGNKVELKAVFPNGTRVVLDDDGTITPP